MKLENVPFLTVEDVEAIREEALLTGGALGIINHSLLEPAVGAARATFDESEPAFDRAELVRAFTDRMRSNESIE